MTVYERLFAAGLLDDFDAAAAGGYGWRVGKSLALGFVEPELAEAGTELEIDVLGAMKPAKIIPESPYDPENTRLRA